MLIKYIIIIITAIINYIMKNFIESSKKEKKTSIRIPIHTKVLTHFKLASSSKPAVKFLSSMCSAVVPDFL